MNKYFSSSDFSVYCGDCAPILLSLPPSLVDLTVTSPPYGSMRQYNGYCFDFERLVEGLYHVTKNGGIVVWIVGDTTANSDETGVPFKQALFFKNNGFKLLDTMIYSKGAQGGAKGSSLCYTQSFEYMFVFFKGDRPHVTSLLCDRENNYKYKGRKKSTMRKSDNNTHSFATEYKPFSKRTNVWEIRGGYMVGSPDAIAFEHPATFPEQLANDHILSWSSTGFTVLDPMCGSGTTLKMALLNNRKAIGIDICEDYCAITVARCLSAQWQTAQSSKSPATPLDNLSSP